MMHSLLARQIEQCTSPDGQLDTDKLIALVSSAYSDDSRARDRLERSIRLMSEEMAELNSQIALEARQTVNNFILKTREPLLAVDSRGAVTLANAAAAWNLGAAEPVDLIGRQAEDFIPGSLATAYVPSEVIAKRLDGTTFPASVTVSVGKVDGENFRLVSIRDESERQARELALKQAKEAAENANEAKSSFLAMMSHELRTPLNALLGSAELLARTPLDEKQAGYLRMFNQAGRLIMAQVNDVLDYSKIEAGQLEIEAHPTSLQDLAAEVGAMWSDPARLKGIDLTVDTGGLDSDMVLGDPTRLRQIIFNLVSNAVKFTTRGGVSINLSSKTEQGVCQLRIDVADTGIGIPPERLESIFSPFVQADSSITRQYGGTGLGLAIARSLATQMDGDLTLVSRIGRGSTFTFSARLAATVLDPAERQAAAHEEDEAPELRVLAVDDNELNRRILGAMLEMWPVEVSWATNGVEALDLLGKSPFDVVLMDAQMPVMDGLTATRRLRAIEGPNRTVPVVALTANVGAADRNACLEAGMTDFVAKPISAESLMGALVRAANHPTAVHAAAE
ncbi:MAG: hybrid sensor histidine kinase/response regulator [Alphaproteobacteria bacterium PA2]|nr:MAG: hybrid sensor histidine kinase/response regulator [Alphaproteobacteria bacterium PA2]